MEKHQFKTNINCSGCVAKITPYLQANPGIKAWNVDTNTPSKILTVESEGLDASDVETIVKNAGFKAEKQ